MPEVPMDPLDLKVIQKLIRMMARGDVTELEIDDAQLGRKVRLRRGAEPGPQPQFVMMGGGGMPMATGMPAAGTAPEAGAAEEDAGGGLPEGAEQIVSPMVGTFYRSPSPDAGPFVSVGSEVSEGDVLCIVEAMKVMNEIKAEVGGEILQVLVENGEPIEFGQPLFLIKTR